MEKVCIFIDGANFYHLVLKKLGFQEIDFDYDGFANFLAGDRKISKNGKRFYVGTVPEKVGDMRTKKAMSNQTTFFTILKKNNWEIKTSKLRRRIEEISIDSRVIGYEKFKKMGLKKIQYERYREKGIDVKLAVDLIVGAIDDKYDTSIVISSDGDIIPAIDWVRNRTDKKIEYVGFSIIDKNDSKNSTNPLLSMISKADIKRILVESDIKPFIQKTLFNK